MPYPIGASSNRPAKEVQGPDSVLGSGIHQHGPAPHGAPRSRVPGRSRGEAGSHLVGGESAEGRAGVKDDQVRYGQQAEGDHPRVDGTPHRRGTGAGRRPARAEISRTTGAARAPSASGSRPTCSLKSVKARSAPRKSAPASPQAKCDRCATASSRVH